MTVSELVSPDCLAPMTVQRRLLIFEVTPLLLVAMCWLWVAVVRLASWWKVYRRHAQPTAVAVRSSGSDDTVWMANPANAPSPRGLDPSSTPEPPSAREPPSRPAIQRKRSLPEQIKRLTSLRSRSAMAFRRQLNADPDHVARRMVERGWRATVIIAFLR